MRQGGAILWRYTSRALLSYFWCLVVVPPACLSPLVRASACLTRPPITDDTPFRIDRRLPTSATTSTHALPVFFFFSSVVLNRLQVHRSRPFARCACAFLLLCSVFRPCLTSTTGHASGPRGGRTRLPRVQRASSPSLCFSFYSGDCRPSFAVSLLNRA